jgi:hypothetical protein
MAERRLYGLIGEFAEAAQAVAAARRLRGDGVRRFEVYSPLPIEEMEPLLSSRPRLWLGLIMFAAACAGAVIGYFMQYAVAVIAYPLNVGGRPLDSWPAFIPIAWEICALFTVYLGFLALLAFCRLPRLYHPIFAAPGFERASQDRIFLCVEAADEKFDVPRLSASFRAAGAVAVREVPR